MYFSQIQASIHVTVLHRHPLKEIDGENRSGTVTEHLFISPDLIRRKQVIQNAHDLCSFAQGNMLTPVSGRSLSRRVFFYLEASDRNRTRRHFKEIKGNRAIYSILARGQGGQLEVRDLSCYCDNCIHENYEQCVNTAHVKE